MEQMMSRDLEKYLKTIGQYDNEFAKWSARTKKIIKRYRDDTRGQTLTESAKFNILWSNVQTLKPAVYAKLPKADISRRFGDNDPVGRVAGQLLERAIDFEIEHYPDFRSTMSYCVEDRFLGGRGTSWVRYEPHVAPIGIEDDGVSVTSNIEQGEGAPPSLERIEYECAPTDYVHWRDFGHSQARTWEEVTCVWRWVYMTREALAERFGDAQRSASCGTRKSRRSIGSARECRRSLTSATIRSASRASSRVRNRCMPRLRATRWFRFLTSFSIKTRRWSWTSCPTALMAWSRRCVCVAYTTPASLRCNAY